MWQEARKQEKHIKTLMVDYKRRAERRRDYYERIKQDPIKFLRVYGRPAKLHLDSDVAKAAENPNNMMPWIGDSSVLIDRFDARANLEHYDSHIPDEAKLSGIERIENRLCNYERYRCLIHNEYASVTEAMALKQIELDEKYGDLEKKRKEDEENSKNTQEPKAAIGFTYENTDIVPGPTVTASTGHGAGPNDSDDSDGEADSDMDIDVELDVGTLGVEARRQLAKAAAIYGLHPSDFVRLLDADQQLETELRLAKALEEEKLQLSGRRSRRSRRLLRERRTQEKFPRIMTAKAGLLNGQPISRRTVYLSASSSDSGDYPSDVDDQEIVDSSVTGPNSKSATVRARRARAKPLLTNARGPSVMIGGMTSISLARRHHKSESGSHIRSKSSSKSPSSSGSDRSSSSSSASSSGHRRRRSSYSSSRSPSSGRRRRSTHHYKTKRSRVEYITTFGDNEDDDPNEPYRKTPTSYGFGSGDLRRHDKPPGLAASAVAASVVSKLLSSSRHSSSSVGQDLGGRYSSLSSLQSSRNLRHSPPRSESRRDRPTTTTTTNRTHYGHSRSRSRSNSGSSRYQSDRKPRSSPPPGRSTNNGSRNAGSFSSYNSSIRRPLSRSNSPPVYKGSISDLPTQPTRSPISSPQINPAPTPNMDRLPSPPIRKRYYRPELESDSDKEFSEDDDNNNGDDDRNGNSTRKSDAAKSSSYGHSGDSGLDSKSTLGSSSSSLGTRLMPQELLKRRVQSQLTKAFNADKKAELEKQLQVERERQAREEGLRRQALLLKRQEEKRIRAELRAAAAGVNAMLAELSSNSPSSSSSRSSSSENHPTAGGATSGGHSKKSRFSSPSPRRSPRRRSSPSRSKRDEDDRGRPSSSPRGFRDKDSRSGRDMDYRSYSKSQDSKPSDSHPTMSSHGPPTAPSGRPLNASYNRSDYSPSRSCSSNRSYSRSSQWDSKGRSRDSPRSSHSSSTDYRKSYGTDRRDPTWRSDTSNYHSDRYDGRGRTYRS